ncbi:MAG: hypothetical protein FJ038_05425 [Chloroflexi bacterium]|nr:hypothetical protein [Chloroflexota bacterium]
MSRSGRRTTGSAVAEWALGSRLRAPPAPARTGIGPAVITPGDSSAPGGTAGESLDYAAAVPPIARVEVFEPTSDLPRRRIFSTGGNNDRGATLVKITDLEGLAGWGETYPVPAGVAVIRAAGALLVGRDPGDATANQDLVRRATLGNGFATSALSIALDDLRARQRGVSVATLYGGPIRTRVRAYAVERGLRGGPWPGGGVDRGGGARDRRGIPRLQIADRT